MASHREPPKFHVVSAWTPTRYPGPNAEERGFRTSPSPPAAPVRPAPTPVAASPIPLPTPATVAPLPSSAPPSEEPLSAPAKTPAPTGLYNLHSLLSRAWSEPPAGHGSSPTVAMVPPAERPAPVLPPSSSSGTSSTSLLATAGASARPFSPSHRGSTGPRAWICPRCRLTNAPWSRACTSCRTAAPHH
ncbi:MAG: hypothetical protein WBG19_02430 [Thermoplasmata archaeon]